MTNFFPKALAWGSESLISFQRIQSLLLLDEVETRGIALEDIPSSIVRNAIGPGKSRESVLCIMENASFHWNKTEVHTSRSQARKSLAAPPPLNHLRDVTMTLKRGSMIGVCGPVGSGKSSLANAILGEMNWGTGIYAMRRNVLSGSVSVGKRQIKIAYASQSPWITPGTILDNILFGHDYDEKWFWLILKACALDVDVARMPEGVHTNVGERGVSLSGGQRARLALARAVYYDADLYSLVYSYCL